jgi:hypothetical protein
LFIKRKTIQHLISPVFIISILLILSIALIGNNNNSVESCDGTAIYNFNDENIEISFEDNFKISTDFNAVLDKDFQNILNSEFNLKSFGCINKVLKVLDYGENFQFLIINSIQMIELSLLIIFSVFLYFNKNQNTLRIFNIYLLTLLAHKVFFPIYFSTSNYLLLYTLKVILIYLLIKHDGKFIIFSIFLSMIIFTDFLNYDLNRDEIHYLGSATLSNNALSAYFSLDHSLIYGFFIKILINNFGINSLYIFELFQIILFSGLISYIIKEYKVSEKIRILFITFFSILQTVFGGEYMFGFLLNKGMGYFAILSSILFIKKKQRYLFLISFLFAVYSHIAVAIINLPFLFIIYYKSYKLKNLIGDFIFLLLGTLPSLYVIRENLLSSNPLQKLEFLEYWIYSRTPHHLAPFNSSGNLQDVWILGLLVYFFLVISLFIPNIVGVKHNSELQKYLFIITGITGFYFLIIYFIPVSSFTILHPFRINTIFMFFYFMWVLDIVFRYLKSFNRTGFIIVFSIICILLSGSEGITKKNPELIAAIELSSELKILDIEAISIELNSLDSLKSELNYIEFYSGIPSVVNFKFFPSNYKDFKNWKTEINKNQSFYSNKCSEEHSNIFPKKYILLGENNECHKLILNVGNYFVYEIPDV